ncbi:hypothetical protein HY772_06255 [Candidatus Woesearchaeota archaeon]|nr:hypothetical protein [Candidatus Woesearchaeota archaeon]
MLHHRYFKSVSLIVFLLLASCATPTTTPSNSNLQVNPPTSQSPKPVAETIRMNNCGGKADAKQTAERFYAVTVEGELSIGVSAEVVKAQVGAKYVSSSGTSKKQELIAPAGTNMEFILLWTEDVKTGTVTVEGKSGQATYQVNTPISVELSSSKDLRCGGSLTQLTTQPAPTPIPIPTSTKVPPTQQPLAATQSAPVQITSVATEGGVKKTYFIRLESKEALTGHADKFQTDKFQNQRGCIAYIIIGPGDFQFTIESGIWYKWINVTNQWHDALLQEQIDILVNKYSCKPPIQTFRLP